MREMAAAYVVVMVIFAVVGWELIQLLNGIAYTLQHTIR